MSGEAEETVPPPSANGLWSSRRLSRVESCTRFRFNILAKGNPFDVVPRVAAGYSHHLYFVIAAVAIESHKP